MSASSPRRIGLPDTIRMRHDTHFVDQLARPGGEAIGRLIPIEEVEPNPHQPRADTRRSGRARRLDPGEGHSRTAPRPSNRRTVPDHRRRAALPRCDRGRPDRATLRHPRVVGRGDDGDRAGREPAAQGPHPVRRGRRTARPGREFGYTHEDMAEKLGKSRSTVTESLSLTAMPEEVRQLCRLADIQSKSVLLQIVRQGEPEKMVAFVERSAG